MGYLRNMGKQILINDEIKVVLFTLQMIYDLQEKTNMPVSELIYSLTGEKTRELAVKCIIKFMFGLDVNDNYEYYSYILLSTYIEQLKYKNMPKPRSNDDDSDYEFINIEYWFYIGTVVLGYSEDKVWNMTLGQLRTLHNEHLKYHGVIKEDKEVSIDEAIPF